MEKSKIGNKDYERLDKALYNIFQFMGECEISLRVTQMIQEKDNKDMVTFYLEGETCDYTVKIEMPIEDIEVLKNEDTNILEVPKVYVDGIPWRWKYALITKEIVKSAYRAQLNDLDAASQHYRKVLNELCWK